MTPVDLVFILGIVLIIAGIIKRKGAYGKWLLATGIAITCFAILLIGYGDFKAGFMDALND